MKEEEVESVQSPASPVSGGGARKEREAAAPSTKLGIGIGGAAVKEERRQLTAEQRDELQRQVVIYKYIAAGVPIPPDLVRPIWKSVDDSLRFRNGANGIYKQYPSFVGFSKGFDYINMMDPDQDRCRRTDGKKWRCRKSVVTGQKYCPQHMHRGRGRSRKPVESSQTSNAPPTNQPSKNSENLNTTCSNSSSPTTKDSGAISRSNGEFKIMGAKLTPMASSAKTMSPCLIKKGTLGLVNAAAVMTTCTVPTDSTVTTATVVADKASGNNFYKVSCVDDSNRNCSTDAGFKDQIDRANACRNLNNANVCTPQKLNFSPKSVLRGDVYLVKTQVEGGNSGFLSLDIEPGRCRRTDGKKWRCRRDVVPDEKYCPAHMHRGAKRQVVAYQSSIAPHTTISSGLHSNSVLPDNVHTSNLDTNLSISIAPNHQLQAKDDKIPSGDGNTANSSSSDTISDTIVANCDYRDVTS